MHVKRFAGHHLDAAPLKLRGLRPHGERLEEHVEPLQHQQPLKRVAHTPAHPADDKVAERSVARDEQRARLLLFVQQLEHTVERDKGLARAGRRLQVHVVSGEALLHLVELVRCELVHGEHGSLICRRKLRAVDAHNDAHLAAGQRV